MSEHAHEWTKRGDRGDPWVQCWLCGEIRNGWLGADEPAREPESDGREGGAA